LPPPPGVAGIPGAAMPMTAPKPKPKKRAVVAVIDEIKEKKGIWASPKRVKDAEGKDNPLLDLIKLAKVDFTPIEKKKKGKKKKEEKEKGKKGKEKCVITDGSRLQEFSIKLKQLKSKDGFTPHDVELALMEVKSKILLPPKDLISRLQVPTDKEVALVRKVIQGVVKEKKEAFLKENGDGEGKGIVDAVRKKWRGEAIKELVPINKYIYQLGEVPFLARRVKSIQCYVEFDALLKSIVAETEKAEQAVRLVYDWEKKKCPNERMQKVFEVMLNVANALNEGSRVGVQGGISIDTMTNFSSIKAPRTGKNLMQYIARMVHGISPEACLFTEDLKPLIENADSIQMGETKQQISIGFEQLSQIKELLKYFNEGLGRLKPEVQAKLTKFARQFTKGVKGQKLCTSDELIELMTKTKKLRLTKEDCEAIKEVYAKDGKINVSALKMAVSDFQREELGIYGAPRADDEFAKVMTPFIEMSYKKLTAARQKCLAVFEHAESGAQLYLDSTKNQDGILEPNVFLIKVQKLALAFKAAHDANMKEDEANNKQKQKRSRSKGPDKKKSPQSNEKSRASMPVKPDLAKLGKQLSRELLANLGNKVANKKLKSGGVRRGRSKQKKSITEEDAPPPPPPHP